MSGVAAVAHGGRNLFGAASGRLMLESRFRAAVGPPYSRGRANEGEDGP